MHGFTPVQAVVGGGLMGVALSLMLLSSGRLAGMSGVIAGVLWPGDRTWRVWFVAGALATGAAFAAASPEMFDAGSGHALPTLALAGVLVGFGTRVGGGCTTGHGFCGTSRMSKRSIVALMTFFAAAVATATLAGTLGGRA
jgi:uncharacterized protein